MADYKWEVDSSKNLLLKDGDGTTIASISGLNSNLTSIAKDYTTDELTNAGFIEFKAHTMNSSAFGTSGIITIKGAALTKGASSVYTISLSSASSTYNGYYTLALEDADSTTSVLGGATIAEYWKVESGSSGNDDNPTVNASYMSAGKKEQWKLTDSSTITYTPQQNGASLATITGLKGGLGGYLNDSLVAAGSLNTNTSLITSSTTTGQSGSSTVFTLSKEALNNTTNASDGNTIILKDENTSDGKDFTLALGTGIAIFDSESSASNPRIGSVSDGTATIIRDQSAGWKSMSAGISFAYNKATTKKLATITNLNASIAAGTATATQNKFGTIVNGVFTEALTISDKVVTLNRNALQALSSTSAITIADDEHIGNDPFTGFKLALNSADSKTIGFEDVDSKWTLSGTTAVYKSTGKLEGWTLSGTSQVTYTTSTAITNLATITNLNANVVEKNGQIGTYATPGDSSTAFTEGITVNEGNSTITLAKAVLTTSAASATTLTQGTKPNGGGSANYSLALKAEDNINASESIPSFFALAQSSTFSSDQSILIQGIKAAGWSLAGTSVTYTAEITEDLATITNLSTAVIADTSGASAGKFGTTIDGKFVEAITLGADKVVRINEAALTHIAGESNATALTRTTAGASYAGISFTLAKGEDAEDPGTAPTKIHLGGLTGTSLSVIGTMTQGWTLSGTSKIIFTAEDDNRVLATITNLSTAVVKNELRTGAGGSTIITRYGTYATPGDSSTAFTEGITLDGTTVTLKQAVLNNSASSAEFTKITQAAGNSFGENYVYKFALDNVVTPAVDNHAITNIRLGGLSMASGAASLAIIGTLSAGWSLSGTSVVAYTAETTPVLATITGLSTAVVAGTSAYAGKFGTGSGSAFQEAISLTDKTVTLKQAALKDGDVIIAGSTVDSIKNTFDVNYNLALADDVIKNGQKINVSSVSISAVSDGTATIQAKKAPHWDLGPGGQSVKYDAETSSASVAVATVTGLNKAIQAGTGSNAGKFGISAADGTFTPVNLSVAKAASGDNIEFKLAEGSLSDSDITIAPLQVEENNTKEKFTLAFVSTGEDGTKLKKYRIGVPFGAASGTTVGFEPIYYWEKTATNTTAYLKADRAEGWTLATTGDDANTKVTYTKEAATGQIVATIKNLQQNLVAEALETEDWDAKGSLRNKIAGISLSDETTNDAYRFDTITLDKGVLTTNKDAATTLTLGKELGQTGTTTANYKLALQNTGDDAKVPTREETGKTGFTQLGTTATYNKLNKTAFWTINNDKNSVTYTPQDVGDVLFTLKGLNSKVTEDDIDVSLDSYGKGTIMLKAKALTNGNVTLVNGKDASGNDLSQTLKLFTSEDFAFAADNVPLSTLTNAKWSLNSTGTTATYKADVATGYEISLDGKTVIYTTGGNKTIATINGLKGGLTVSDDGSYIGVKDENDIISRGLTLEDKAATGSASFGIYEKVITLTSDVLGTTNVSMTGTGIGANYTLDLNTTTAGLSVPTTTAQTVSGTAYAAKSAGGKAPDLKDVWRVSGTNNTTATYKQVVPLYYTINDGSRGITYHAEDTKQTYATVTGLKKGLVVNDAGSAVGVATTDENTGVTTIAEDVKIKGTSTTDKLVIVVGKDALAAASVKLTNGGTAKYTFELATGDNKPDGPTRDEYAALTFVQDGTTKTTAHLKGTLTAGYTLADDKTAINYSTKNTNHTFATITGLKSGLAASDFSGNNAGIRIKDDDDKKTIVLDLKMLGASDVKLDEAGATGGYSLAAGTGVLSATEATTTSNLKNIWAVNATTPTTYNYKTIFPDSYTLGSQKFGNETKSNTMLTYKKESDKETLATITNLKSGLKISADRSSINGIKIGSVDATTGEFTENTAENQGTGTIIQLSKDVLVNDASKPVGITGKNTYKLAITDDVKAKKKDPYWSVSGTTATYKYDTTAGFVVTTGTTAGDTGTAVTYQAAKTGNTATPLATLTGLKSGLSVKSDGSIDGIKFGKWDSNVFKEGEGDKDVIQLSNNVLDNKTVELTLPSGAKTQYKLALEKLEDLKQKSNQYALEVGTDGVVTLKTGYTTAGYETSSQNGTSTKFNYKEGSGGTAQAKITGLKSGLKAVDGAIEGIDIGKIAETGDYDSAGNKISKFKVDTATSSNADAMIRLSAGVLNGKDVEIKLNTGSTTNYTLAIKTEKDSDTDATSTLVATPVYTKAWKVPTKGKVTFTETTTEGYTLDETTGSATKDKKIIYSDKKVVTTTLNGLSNDVKLIDLDATNEDGLNPDGTKVKVAGIDKNNYVKFTAATEPSGGGDPDTEEEVVKNKGKFTLGSKVLKAGNVTLTNDKTYGAYTLELATGVAAENYNGGVPQWFKDKNSDTATYSVKTKPGYTLASDGLKVNYSTKDTYTHYATLKGLNKDIEAENGALAGVDFGTVAEEVTTGTGNNQTYSYTKQILLGYDALTSSDVTVTGETKDDVTSTDGSFTNTDLTNGYKAEYILAFKDDDTNPTADTVGNDGKEWYQAQHAAPTWTFNKKQGTATLSSGTTGSWAIKETKTGTGTNVTTVSDPKTIVYTAGTTETLATVSGLNVVTKDSVNTVEGLSLNTWSRSTTGTGTNTKNTGTGTIFLTLDSLNKKNVTVEVDSSAKDRYTFAFDLEGNVAEPFQKANVWMSDGKGNATYQYTVTEGYTLDADKKTTLTYSPEETTTLAKLTGLNATKFKKTEGEGEATLEGIEVTQSHTDEIKDASGKVTTAAAKGVITLTNASMLGKTVKITGDKYQLGLSEEVAAQLAGEKWYLSGTTATYKKYFAPGYNLNEAKTTATQATKEAAGDTILTIKGLKKNLKLDTVNEGISVSDDNTVAVKDTVLGTTKVTLENGTYKDENDKDVKYEYQFAAEGFATPEKQTPKWGFSKGTANLMQNTTKGFTLGSSDSTKELNDVLTYSAAKNVSIAKVKGLNTALKVFNETTYTDDNGNTVTGNVIGTTKTETINGKKTTVLDKAVVTFDEANTSIVLGEKAFNKKAVSVSGDGNYTLAFGNMGSTQTAEDQVTKWVVSGTTGSFKQYKPLYYTLSEDSKSIAYTKEDSPKESIFAKVTNLKKNTELTAQAFSTESVTNPNYTVDNKDVGDKGHVLTLYADNLNKKSIALSGNAGYALALGEDVAKSTVTAATSATANGSGKAVFTGTRKAGYELAFGSKSVTYISKDKNNQAVATVTGLKRDARISASDGVIALDGGKLNKKTVTLTSNLGTVDYTFAVSEDATLKAPTVTLRTKDDGSKNYWNLKGTTASIMGAVTEDGYILSESKKALTYIKKTATYSNGNPKQVSIATIKGMTGTDVSSVDATTRTISLSGSNLGSKVTVNGGAFSFKIDDKFNEASLTGSSAADRITVSGSGLTITGGNGDDAIDLGSGGNNTFVYANGQGNDVIAGFTPGNDILKVTKGTITVEHDSNDVIVKVGAGKIRLKGAYAKDSSLEGMNLVIHNNKNVETTYFVPDAQTMTYANSSNTLLEDNNYSADAAQLSSIVEPHEATYTPYDFDANNLGLTKEDKLTSAAVTYSGDTNKK